MRARRCRLCLYHARMRVAAILLALLAACGSTPTDPTPVASIPPTTSRPSLDTEAEPAAPPKLDLGNRDSIARAVMGIAPGVAASVPGDVPEWGLPGDYVRVGLCGLAAGQQWPNGEPVRDGALLHPQGWGSDPHMLADPEGGFHCWMNWPDPKGRSNGGRGTQIAYLHSTDEEGLRWTVPRVVLHEDMLPVWANNGVETPSVAYSARYNKWTGCVLAKQFLPGTDKWQGRTDSLAFFDLPAGPAGPWVFAGRRLEINPEAEFEQKWFNGQRGYWDGGLQEPAIHWFSDVLVVWYTAHTYGGGWRPATGVAAWVESEQRWLRWPTPVITDGGQIDIERLPQGGLRAYTQSSPGTAAGVHKFIACRFSWDGFNWSEPKFVVAPRPEDPTLFDSRRVVAPSAERGYLWYWCDGLENKTNHVVLMREGPR